MSEPETIPPEFWHGVAQFNQRQFYDCHDTLEAIWMEAPESQRAFYQGILQIGVALYHLSNQNLRGAMILLGEGVNRLRRYHPSYAGIDVDQLMDQSLDLLTLLQQTPPEQMAIWAEQITQTETQAQGQTEPGDRSATLPFQVPTIQTIAPANSTFLE